MYLKNQKGRIVDVSDERGKYLLDPNPVLMRRDGKPKTDNDGNTFPLVKSKHEEGYTVPTKAEIKAYEDQQEAEQAQSQEEADMREAGARAIAGAAMLANRAVKTAAKKPTKKVEQKEDEELEATVRDAEDDAKKYDELTEEGKALYLELFGDAPEGAK